MFDKGISTSLSSYCTNAMKMLKINLYVSLLVLSTAPSGMRISKPTLTCHVATMCVTKRYGLIRDTSALHADRGVATVSAIIMSYVRNQRPYSNIIFKNVCIVTMKGEGIGRLQRQNFRS